MVQCSDESVSLGPPDPKLKYSTCAGGSQRRGESHSRIKRGVSADSSGGRPREGAAEGASQASEGTEERGERKDPRPRRAAIKEADIKTSTEQGDIHGLCRFHGHDMALGNSRDPRGR